MMFRCLLPLTACLCAAMLGAQTLRVRLSPDAIYAGDAFQLEVAAEGARLRSVDFTFSLPTQTLGQSTSLATVNGRTSSSVSYQVLPNGTGHCRLERLTAVTDDGRTLSFGEHPTIEIRTLKPDPALTLTLESTPENPLPGDDVTLTLTVRAPALLHEGQPLSPFLETDLFGRTAERFPNVSFSPVTGEDSPLRQNGRPQATRDSDGDHLIWRISLPYRAVRAGEQTFPAPIIRDTRVTGVDVQGQPIQERCATLGKPLTVRVVPPPTEGRPEGFTGAIGRTFGAEATLDALNAKVGDPVRLTLRFRTDGDSALLRAPTLPRLSGFRAYGEPVRESAEGACSFVYNLRPLQAGLLEIPPLTFAWFDRETRTYRTERTSAVPLRVKPSAQLVLLGDDGQSPIAELPPALRFAAGTPPKTSPAPWALWALTAGVLAAVLRLLGRPTARLCHRLAAPVIRRRPTARAVTALTCAKTPAEAAAVLRTWAGRPALTAIELRTLLPDTSEAAEAVRAYAALEQSMYAGGGDLNEIRETLCRVLPRLPRPYHRRHTKGTAILLLAALTLPILVRAVPDPFVREQAESLSIAANTPEDYAKAANLWLRLAREDDLSRPVLLNGASCAVFARQPAAAAELLRRYERLYGRDSESDRGTVAAYARLGRPLSWPRTLFAPHFLYSLSMRGNVLCAAAGLFLLLCALPWRRLRPWRLAVATGVVVFGISVFVSWVQERAATLPGDLPETPQEEEATK